jgi:hypothetical protein
MLNFIFILLNFFFDLIDVFFFVGRFVQCVIILWVSCYTFKIRVW